MEKGVLKNRRKAKALRLLRRGVGSPRFTTTEVLSLLDAECGAVSFHKILMKRGLAKPVTVHGRKAGYHFSLPSACGSGTLSIEHHSFRWTAAGAAYVARILTKEGIAHQVPSEIAVQGGAK